MIEQPDIPDDGFCGLVSDTSDDDGRGGILEFFAFALNGDGYLLGES